VKIPFIGEFGRKSAKDFEDVPLLLQLAMTDTEAETETEKEDYQLYENQARAYNQIDWIYAAVTRIAEACAMIPFQVYKRNEEDITPESNHEFERLICNPSPHFSRYELWEQTIIHLELQGNAYWFLAGDTAGTPSQIEILRPHEILPHPHRTQYIDYYRLERNSKVTLVPPERIVHFKRYHPRKKYVGLSAIEAATRSLGLEDSTYKYNRSFFGNNARPSGILQTDQVLSPETQRRVERAWKERFKGEDSAHKTALMMGGIKFQQVGLPPKDAEFVTMKGLNRDEILAIYGVSTSNLGIVKDVNKSNAEAMYNMFIRDTIKPKLIAMAEKITSAILIPKYGIDYLGKFDEVSTETKDQSLTEMGIVAKAGVLTVNEYRAKYLNLKPIKGGDVLMAALGGKDLEDFIGEIKGWEYNNEKEE